VQTFRLKTILLQHSKLSWSIIRWRRRDGVKLPNPQP
jgi:hypothetical protein